jgi:ankyrin repeat protein
MAPVMFSHGCDGEREGSSQVESGQPHLWQAINGGRLAGPGPGGRLLDGDARDGVGVGHGATFDVHVRPLPQRRRRQRPILLPTQTQPTPPLIARTQVLAFHTLYNFFTSLGLLPSAIDTRSRMEPASSSGAGSQKEPKEHHHLHRSKSQMAKSLLGRVASRHETDADSSTAPSAPSPGPPSASQSNISLSSQPTSTPSRSSLTLSSKRASRHRPHLSTTMSPDKDVAPTSAASSSGPIGAPPSPTAMSIEQSVKLFRLFEALRGGDTAAIQRAIREQPSAELEAGQSATTSTGRIEGTTILHLAIQCAELPVIEFVLSNITRGDVNARDREGNAPLHVAAKLGRAPVVGILLEQDDINDSITNYHGQTPLDVAYTPEIFQQLQLFRSLFVDANIRNIHALVAKGDHDALEKVLKDPRVRSTLDVNGGELATDPTTIESGGTLLHEAARKRDIKLIQMLLLNGADPFRRDRKGKLPQDVTKDDRTRAILKKSPAAAEARQGIQEKSILGSGSTQNGGAVSSEAAISNKEAREMKGYLKKWTNYTGGWKLRWFVLEDGVLSYYKHQGKPSHSSISNNL